MVATFSTFADKAASIQSSSKHWLLSTTLLVNRWGPLLQQDGSGLTGRPELIDLSRQRRCAICCHEGNKRWVDCWKKIMFSPSVTWYVANLSLPRKASFIKRSDAWAAMSQDISRPILRSFIRSLRGCDFHGEDCLLHTRISLIVALNREYKIGRVNRNTCTSVFPVLIRLLSARPYTSGACCGFWRLLQHTYLENQMLFVIEGFWQCLQLSAEAQI